MNYELGASDASFRSPSALTLQNLRYALAAAEHGSFRRAGEVLLLQQSTLSRCVRQLEDSIGMVVFERSSGGVRATPAGRQFLRKRAVDPGAGGGAGWRQRRARAAARPAGFRSGSTRRCRRKSSRDDDGRRKTVSSARTRNVREVRAPPRHGSSQWRCRHRDHSWSDGAARGENDATVERADSRRRCRNACAGRARTVQWTDLKDEKSPSQPARSGTRAS